MRTIPEGAKVKFTHDRLIAGFENDGPLSIRGLDKNGLHRLVAAKGQTEIFATPRNFPIRPRGGLTECRLTLADDTEIVTFAECSTKDNYSKRIGRDISLGRALASLEAA